MRIHHTQRGTRTLRRLSLGIVMSLGGAWALSPALAGAAPTAFINGFTPTTIATTQPTNLDENPYGIVTVPRSVGSLQAGDLLISNFNNSSNTQGTGTTIVQIPPTGNDQVAGDAALFAQIPSSLSGCPGGVGLTTALSVTRTGYVIVGSLPTPDGQLDMAGAGCLIVLDPNGNVVGTISGGPINGPWDMTATENGIITTLYVSNVENGAVATSTTPVDEGTVVRIRLLTLPGIAPIPLSERVIGSGFPELASSSAVVLGPTGDALASNGTLYVADTEANRIAAIPHADTRLSALGGGGDTVSTGGSLNAPLGLALAPNGDILTVNGNDGLLVETNPHKGQIASLDTGFGGGSLFGLTISPGVNGIYAVDDGNNTLAFIGP